jgi:quercetin dioxygenase-like cupin family protein
VKIYQFNKEAGKRITKFDSDFVMSRITQTQKSAHVACMYLEAGGVIGFHEAVLPQLLLVVAGEGWVRGDRNEYIKIQKGQAAFWNKGEWHETKTSNGLTAIVIESEELNVSSMKAL